MSKEVKKRKKKAQSLVKPVKRFASFMILKKLYSIKIML